MEEVSPLPLSLVDLTTNLGWMIIIPSTQLQAQELRRTLGAQRRSWCWFVHRDQQRYLRYR